jgi:hypothetical protein
LASLAYQLGFDADVVWNDESNTDLRNLRSDPNILLPGDILHIPDQADRASPPITLATGTTNTFMAHSPPIQFTVRFSDPGYASQAFTVPELPDLTGQTTGADGTVTLSVPVTLSIVTFVFSDVGGA